MPPANEGQREPALPALSYLYILIPLCALISIALITRLNKSRRPASVNVNNRTSAPNTSEKPINTHSADKTPMVHCTTGAPFPDHQAQQLELNAFLAVDHASRMKSPTKTAPRPASLPDVEVQPRHQLSDRKPIRPAVPSPFVPDLPRIESKDLHAPHQLQPPPAPHWQPEETACLVDDIPSTHPHPFGFPVMQKQPVDFPQVQREAVQFFPRAGPDKRQAWRRRILECN
ncbi:hypothetical protein AJ78_03306 [Emergomyces pasteurianus Ep9510]|uniref:Uncharacterized protein n=1 Tax=Emergomyces pasteurianus Ep9510 TaxID=1447872 RepID=A0A1J9PJA1_9EURO|nr:hypothetical protein AJ78_03306 [Emergomyces pasteurianus Ep9510]